MKQKTHHGALQICSHLKAAAAFTEDKAGRRAALATAPTPILIVAGDNDISTASTGRHAASASRPAGWRPDAQGKQGAA